MNTPSTICERLADVKAALQKAHDVCAGIVKIGGTAKVGTLVSHANSATWQLSNAIKQIDAIAALPPPSPVARDGWVMVPREVMDLYQFMKLSFVPFTSQHEQIAISLRKATDALAAAPTPPQAHAGEVVAGSDDEGLKCPRVFDDQLVMLKFNDQQGRRYTSWKRAQELGDLILSRPAPASVSVEAVRALVTNVRSEWNGAMYIGKGAHRACNAILAALDQQEKGNG